MHIMSTITTVSKMSATSINDIIKLNVGGETFLTTRATLTFCPDSLLAKMFNPNSDYLPAVTEDGDVYFLDVNPRYFAIILEWLRHWNLMVSPGIDMDHLNLIANYFGLEELSQVIQEKKEEDNKKKNENSKLDTGLKILNDISNNLDRISKNSLLNSLFLASMLVYFTYGPIAGIFDSMVM